MYKRQDTTTIDSSLIATSTNDMIILSANEDSISASEGVSQHDTSMSHKWRVKVNGNRSAQFTVPKRNCCWSQVIINGTQVLTNSETKYLGLHLDKNNAWLAHIKARKQQTSLEIKTEHGL